MYRIDPEHLAQFRENGFLALEGFVSPDACDALKKRAEALVEQFDPEGVVSIFSTREQARTSDDYFMESGDKIRFFFEEAAFGPGGAMLRPKELSINKIGHALHDLDPEFDKFSRTEDLSSLASDLGFNEPLLLQSMYIFKQPGIGGEVGCHQDSTFLFTEPPSAVGFWFALEDASVENGCLRVIPGGHRAGLKSRFVRKPGGARFEVFDDSPWPLESLVPLEVLKGTLILLDGLLPHMSYPNNSAKSRHAYTLHVIEGSSAYLKDNWLQRGPRLPLRGFR